MKKDDGAEATETGKSNNEIHLLHSPLSIGKRE
jgi:hypothetical protein